MNDIITRMQEVHNLLPTVDTVVQFLDVSCLLLDALDADDGRCWIFLLDQFSSQKFLEEPMFLLYFCL